MSSRETWVDRFYIYVKDIQQFVEYCKRQQINIKEDLQVSYQVDKENVDDGYIWKDCFICDVTNYSEMNSIKFINTFSLFFRESKYCSRI